MVEQQDQLLLPFIDRPSGGLKTGGQGLQKRKRGRVIGGHTSPILQQIEKAPSSHKRLKGL
ncbi:MAG: hypothetical protein Q8Q74_03905 [Polaromonas sp.]|nr:hypothetical protein [Polaromonas sp.]